MKLTFNGPGLRPIGQTQIQRAHELAAKSPRGRAIVRYHEHADLVQRMLNALTPGTYVPVHRHLEKVEIFLALQGRCAVCRFDTSGALLQVSCISPDGPLRGVEIPMGTWHTVVCLSQAALLYEIIQGPYSALTHKEQAPFCPKEASAGVSQWMAQLRRSISAASV